MRINKKGLRIQNRWSKEMKKIFLLLSGFLVLIIFPEISIADNPIITIQSPVEGEQYYCGENIQIKWTISGEEDNNAFTTVYCMYRESGKEIRIYIKDYYHKERNGNVSWTLPSEVCHKQIYIFVTLYGPKYPSSVEAMKCIFTVKFICIHFESPNSNGDYFSGSPLLIKWRTNVSRQMPPRQVQAFLSRPLSGGGREDIPLGYVTFNYRGTFVWNIPQNFTANNAFVFFVHHSPEMVLEETTICNKSASFSIYPPPQLSIVSPKSDEIYHPGEEMVISWRSSGGKPGSVVFIHYSFPPDPLRDVDFVDVAQGSHRWRIPENAPSTHQAKIIIEWKPNRNSDKVWFRATSDNFIIQPKPGATKVIIRRE